MIAHTSTQSEANLTRAKYAIVRSTYEISTKFFEDSGSPSRSSFLDSPNYLDQIYTLPEALDKLKEKIKHLSFLSENWNGNSVSKPEELYIQIAQQKISDYFFEVKEENWRMPLVTADENGEVVLEWWNNSKKLTLYFGETNPFFLKVWGPNINTQMEDGEITNTKDFKDVWNWLNQ